MQALKNSKKISSTCQNMQLEYQRNHFYKGFYQDYFDLKDCYNNEEDFEGFYFMENICESFDSDDLNPIDLWKYIHGYCDEFAMMLSKLYGYEIKLAFEGDGFHTLIHAWCQVDEYFIDVRGITNDSDLFFSEYDMRNTKIYTCKNVNEFISFARRVLQQEEKDFCVICEEELNKLECDSYMEYYYKF